MASIGIFDSGYGGLTILRSIRHLMPQYDYIYLGDNARAPYGSRSFETVYHYTRQAVEALFRNDCQLIILACNTASAKALRTIQQNDLLRPEYAGRRVLGVIRPTVEVIGDLSKSRHVGLLATSGTVKSNSYALEIEKLHPDIKLSIYKASVYLFFARQLRKSSLVDFSRTHPVGAQRDTIVWRL